MERSSAPWLMGGEHLRPADMGCLQRNARESNTGLKRPLLTIIERDFLLMFDYALGWFTPGCS
jgi:hypothetical protein